MHYQIEPQLSIAVANMPGEIARITNLLSRAKVTIRAMTLTDEPDRGYFRLLSHDIDNAINVLKTNGFVVEQDRVISVRLNDRKGQLASITHALAQAQINLDYVYTSLDSGDASVCLTMKVEQIPLATRVLDEIANAPSKVPILEFA